jgi:acyl-CoA dehydrogenase
VIYAEQLHWGCAGIALAISGSSLAAAGIASAGTPEQIGRWVPECFGTGDEVKLGAYAVTEAGAGSDVKSLRTTAVLDGDEWVLNGTKVFITNGGIADVTVVVATVDRELGHRGQASFVVPKGTPGLSQGKKESKLGIRASHTAEVVLDDCRVPMEYLLGGHEKLQRKIERARSGGSTGRSSGALATFEVSRARWSAPRRSGSRRPRTSGPPTTSRVVRRTGSRFSTSSGCSRSSPTSPPR